MKTKPWTPNASAIPGGFSPSELSIADTLSVIVEGADSRNYPLLTAIYAATLLFKQKRSFEVRTSRYSEPLISNSAKGLQAHLAIRPFLAELEAIMSEEFKNGAAAARTTIEPPVSPHPEAGLAQGDQQEHLSSGRNRRNR